MPAYNGIMIGNINLYYAEVKNIYAGKYLKYGLLLLFLRL